MEPHISNNENYFNSNWESLLYYFDSVCVELKGEFNIVELKISNDRLTWLEIQVTYLHQTYNDITLTYFDIIPFWNIAMYLNEAG